MHLNRPHSFFGLLAVFIIYGCSTAGHISKDRPTPQLSNGRYTITLADQTLEIDPAAGGRITSLRLNQEEFLIGKDINPTNWGSTFWPSPQSAWNWPPLPEIDSQPYATTINDQVLKLISEPDHKLGLVVTKEIWGNKKDQSFTIKYTLTNQANKAQKVAPWEITRVFPEGITFYPTGQSPKTGTLAPYTQEKNGITCFAYQKEKIPAQHLKLFADGAEGWLAQVNNRLLLIKKFPDLPLGKAAPAEGEIEIYSALSKNYIEIEQQGQYTELQPGTAITWEVTWYLRKLPGNIKAEAGNAELTAYVRQIINK